MNKLNYKQKLGLAHGLKKRASKLLTLASDICDAVTNLLDAIKSKLPEETEIPNLKVLEDELSTIRTTLDKTKKEMDERVKNGTFDILEIMSEFSELNAFEKLAEIQKGLTIK
jgi:hypothetical protein